MSNPPARPSADPRVPHTPGSVESNYRFLLRLNDRLRHAATADEIHAVAVNALGEALRAHRVGYAEGEVADGETLILRPQFVDGVAPLAGRFRIADYRADLLRRMLTGRTFVQNDVGSDPTLSAAERAANAAYDVVAAITVPVVKRGRLLATLFVHAARARVWTADEVALAEAVAERTWDALERARAEERLRLSEDRLSVACEAGAIGIFDHDVVQRTTYWDARTRELLGVGPDAEATTEVFLSAVHPDDVAATASAMKRALDPVHGGACMADFRVRRRTDGAERWIHVRGTATFRGAEPLRLVGTLQDVTAARATEIELRESDRRKDELLATLSHELRNPLAPIVNGLKVLERHALPPDCARAVEMCGRQIRHVSRLVDDLLDASRISRGHVALVPERIDLRRCAGTVADAFSETASARRLQLRLDVPEDPVWVWADPVRIAQVVENLLSNAVRYSEPGGRIDLRIAAEGDAAVLEVRDTGIGIRPADLQRVFDMFVQVHGEAVRGAGGLGIGLALVRRLVEAHGGRVTASSDGPGRGASFRVALARADGGAAPSARVR